MSTLVEVQDKLWMMRPSLCGLCVAVGDHALLCTRLRCAADGDDKLRTGYAQRDGVVDEADVSQIFFGS
jgi:hypothetical protein